MLNWTVKVRVDFLEDINITTQVGKLPKVMVVV